MSTAVASVARGSRTADWLREATNPSDRRRDAPSEWGPYAAATSAAVLLVVALLPVAALSFWQRPSLRPVLLALCWILAVGFTVHGLVDDVQRVLSLTGTPQIHYPFFTTIMRLVIHGSGVVIPPPPTADPCRQ